MTEETDIDVRLRTIAMDALKALLAEMKDLPDREVAAVASRFAEQMENLGYPMAELHLIHSAADYELRVRERQGASEDDQ